MFDDANQHYWSADVGTLYAGCGVIQAAYDAGLSATDVSKALFKVGVQCKVFLTNPKALTGEALWNGWIVGV